VCSCATGSLSCLSLRSEIPTLVCGNADRGRSFSCDVCLSGDPSNSNSSSLSRPAQRERLAGRQLGCGLNLAAPQVAGGEGAVLVAWQLMVSVDGAFMDEKHGMRDRAAASVAGTGDEDVAAHVFDADLDGDGHVSVNERARLVARVWRATPLRVRQLIVSVVGVTLIVLGAALVVVPGPFTLPLLVAGLAVLGTEFAWAHKMLMTVRGRAAKVSSRVRRRLTKS
jgi:hypothetical protein